MVGDSEKRTPVFQLKDGSFMVVCADGRNRFVEYAIPQGEDAAAVAEIMRRTADYIDRCGAYRGP